jgi:hypothetical protein
MTLKPGWLNRQFTEVEHSIRQWPNWMRQFVGFEDLQTVESPSRARSHGGTKLGARQVDRKTQSRNKTRGTQTS